MSLIRRAQQPIDHIIKWKPFMIVTKPTKHFTVQCRFSKWPYKFVTYVKTVSSEANVSILPTAMQNWKWQIQLWSDQSYLTKLKTVHLWAVNRWPYSPGYSLMCPSPVKKIIDSVVQRLPKSSKATWVCIWSPALSFYFYHSSACAYS